jgi:hypothetical protein
MITFATAALPDSSSNPAHSGAAMLFMMMKIFESESHDLHTIFTMIMMTIRVNFKESNFKESICHVSI